MDPFIVQNGSQTSLADYNMGYNAHMFPDFQIGDVVKMRKMHPCGGYEWKIYRLGADIGLECLNCQRRVFLSRRELAHKLKTITTAKAPGPKSE